MPASERMMVTMGAISQHSASEWARDKQDNVDVRQTLMGTSPLIPCVVKEGVAARRPCRCHIACATDLCRAAEVHAHNTSPSTRLAEAKCKAQLSQGTLHVEDESEA